MTHGSMVQVDPSGEQESCKLQPHFQQQLEQLGMHSEKVLVLPARKRSLARQAQAVWTLMVAQMRGLCCMVS